MVTVSGNPNVLSITEVITYSDFASIWCGFVELLLELEADLVSLERGLCAQFPDVVVDTDQHRWLRCWAKFRQHRPDAYTQAANPI